MRKSPFHAGDGNVLDEVYGVLLFAENLVFETMYHRYYAIDWPGRGAFFFSFQDQQRAWRNRYNSMAACFAE